MITITVEKRNPRGVYAKELSRWLNYSKFYDGEELEVGRSYRVELDGDFIMKAEPISKPISANGNGKNAPGSSLINSPAYLSLKLAVELYSNQTVEPAKVIQTARMFKKYLEEEL